MHNQCFVFRSIKKWAAIDYLPEHQIEEARLNYARLCKITQNVDQFFTFQIGFLFISIIPQVCGAIFLIFDLSIAVHPWTALMFTILILTVLITGAKVNNAVSLLIMLEAKN